MPTYNNFPPYLLCHHCRYKHSDSVPQHSVHYTRFSPRHYSLDMHDPIAFSYKRQVVSWLPSAQPHPWHQILFCMKPSLHLYHSRHQDEQRTYSSKNKGDINWYHARIAKWQMVYLKPMPCRPQLQHFPKER